MHVQRRRGLASLVAIAAAAATLLAGCSGSKPTDRNATTGQGFVAKSASETFYSAGDRKPAPDLVEPAVMGGKVDLASYRGKVVVINFWASWCAPCRAEVSGLEAVATANAGKVQFVGVATRDAKSNVAQFIRDHKMTYPSILDEDGTIAARFPQVPQTLPSTIILDRDGRVAARVVAPIDRGDLQTLLDHVLGQPA